MGSINCLSVSEGDITITFDSNNAAEAIRAKRMIRDMLRRGYALLVKLEDGTYTRCLEFDEASSEYIVADFDPVIAAEQDNNDVQEIEKQTEEAKAIQPNAKKFPGPGRPRGRKRLDMSKSHATAIAPSSGG